MPITNSKGVKSCYKESCNRNMIGLSMKNPNAMHYLAAGLTDDIELVIDGSAGYFVGTMIHGAKIHIKWKCRMVPGR